jgi:hypothetical protein
LPSINAEVESSSSVKCSAAGTTSSHQVEQKFKKKQQKREITGINLQKQQRAHEKNDMKEIKENN